MHEHQRARPIRDTRRTVRIPKRWLSSEPFSKSNIHERCNLAARKRQGYAYEHKFSEHWE